MNIEIKQKELHQYFSPFINREYKDSDPQIQYVFRQNRLKFSAERLKTFFRQILENSTRKPEDVKRQYNDSWKKIDYNQLNLQGKYCKNLYTVQWGDRYFDINISGIARLHLFCIKKIIDSLGPASVTEIGFGSGNKLLPLSVAFPNIKFGGIELSDSGIVEAKRIIDNRIFPDEFQNFIPFSLHDYKALNRLEIFQGSAEKLPFPDKSYDLVYTSQALEQMESIREQVMFEISRVAKKYVLMIEPFRDWNEKGMRRNRIAAKNYFAARIADLSQYGLKPIYTKEDLPSKLSMHVGIVLAEVVN